MRVPVFTTSCSLDAAPRAYRRVERRLYRFALVFGRLFLRRSVSGTRQHDDLIVSLARVRKTCAEGREVSLGHGLKLRLPLRHRSRVGNDDLVAGFVGAVANGFIPFIPIWTKLRDPGVTRNRIQRISSIRRQTVVA